MHKAKLTTSPRLQAVFNCLKIRPMTTMEISRIANVCAVNSIISELRQNGIDITCTCKSKGVFEYKLNIEE